MPSTPAPGKGLPIPSGMATLQAVETISGNASQPLPSATYSGWDSVTEQQPLWAGVGTGGGGVTAVTGTVNQISVTGTPTEPIVGLAPPAPAPTPGSYTNATITVDGFGRVTTAASGGVGLTSIQTQTGPAVSLTSAGNTVAITTPSANTINLETLGGGGPAAGPVGAVQYTNGSGVFQGNSGMVYDGTSRLTNANGNFIDFDNVGNSLLLESSELIKLLTPKDVKITGNQSLLLESPVRFGITALGGSGTATQVLTAVGDGSAVWASTIQGIQGQGGPLITLASAGNTVTITTPTPNTINLETAGGGGPAAGPVGAVQYTNGAGVFQGNSGLLYDGTSRLTNTTSGNFIDFNGVSGSLLLESAQLIKLLTPNDVRITGNQSLLLESPVRFGITALGGSGAAGNLLTAVGDGSAVWSAAPAGLTSIQAQTGPAITLTSAGASVAITTPTPNTINLEASGVAGVTSVNTNVGAVVIGGASGVLVTGAGINPIIVSAPGIAAAQATADGAVADAAAAQADATAAGLAAAAADAAAVAAQATADGAAVTAAAAAAAAAAISASYVSQITAGTGITISGSTGNVTINATAVTAFQATYYKTTAQNLTSGNTDITFDGLASWNNTGGYITHVSGTTDFTVTRAGLYQLEFNAVILVNSGSWTSTSNKTINIDITRIGIAEQAVITSSSIQGVQSYGQSICGTIYLVVGDIINLRIGNTFTGTPVPSVQQLQNTFDLNTFFTWRYIP